MDSNLSSFLKELAEAYKNNNLKRILLSKPSSTENNAGKIVGRIVEIKNEKKISFVFEYETKNITKNFSIEESTNQLRELLGNDFKNGILFTEKHDIRLSFNKKWKSHLEYNKATILDNISLDHNKEKMRSIAIDNNIYLKELGIVSQENKIVPNRQSKFKQINKYIETIDSVIKNSELNTKKEINVVDMGSGKGYLTFATYDYLNNILGIKANIIGVELRAELVKICNDIAIKCYYKNLKFHQGDIQSFQSERNTDVLIALHACDTATDDAIFQGINLNASVIITAPCCHKQIRKELNISSELNEIAKYGILKERQAEIITDTLRGLILESHGYSSQIFEFIADAHTHKNVMIVGIKNNTQPNRKTNAKKISNLKELFGIKNFYLEELFKKK